MSLIQSIENDLKAAGTWLEDEVEHEGEAVWSIVETVFKQVPDVISNVVTSFDDYLETVEKEVLTGTPLETVEQDFLEWAETQGQDLITDAKSIGSTLLQGLLALAIHSL
jgi:hypothetical protein